MLLSSIRFGLAAAMIAVSAVGASADHRVRGYTYIAPSYYLTPPVVAAPVVVAPAPAVVPRPIYAPVVYEPAFLHTTVVPYDPVWPYAYMGLPGRYYREKIDVDRDEIEYQLKAYGPRGAKTVYSYEVDATRRGVKVRERVR
jgi:hypothetical protein